MYEGPRDSDACASMQAPINQDIILNQRVVTWSTLIMSWPWRCHVAWCYCAMRSCSTVSTLTAVLSKYDGVIQNSFVIHLAKNIGIYKKGHLCLSMRFSELFLAAIKHLCTFENSWSAQIMSSRRLQQTKIKSTECSTLPLQKLTCLESKRSLREVQIPRL